LIKRYAYYYDQNKYQHPLKIYQDSTKSVYLVILVFVVTSLTISDLHDFKPFNVAASPAVTITPNDGEEDKFEDEGDDETLSSETEENQNGEAVQSASNAGTPGTNDQDYEGDYHIVIPDGAAWKETLSERFYPPEIIIPSGSDVTWSNDDDLTHTITSGNKAGYGMYEFLQDGVFNSGELDEGESFTFQFAEPGRYEYFCVPHPWMNGVIVVK
jgi:plastocyanin